MSNCWSGDLQFSFCSGMARVLPEVGELCLCRSMSVYVGLCLSVCLSVSVYGIQGPAAGSPVAKRRQNGPVGD